MDVSVCLASYNGSAYIFEQIFSILDSFDYAGINNFEILVSDDGSTDSTQDIVNSVVDYRVKLLRGPQSGLIKNFEYLLQEASGAVIFLTDQDDVWKKEKVFKCLSALNKSDLVVSDANVVDQNLNMLHESFFALRNSGPGFYKNLIKNSYLGCCMCFKRKKLIEAKCLPFPHNLPMHDWWIGLLFEKTAKVDFIPDKLVCYRRHANNASDTGQLSTASLSTKIKWRINLSYQLLKRLWG